MKLSLGHQWGRPTHAYHFQKLSALYTVYLLCLYQGFLGAKWRVYNLYRGLVLWPRNPFVICTESVRWGGRGVLFKGPYFNVLHIEVLCFREHWIPKGLTRVSSAMIEVAIQPQAKFTSKRKIKIHLDIKSLINEVYGNLFSLHTLHHQKLRNPDLLWWRTYCHQSTWKPRKVQVV